MNLLPFLKPAYTLFLRTGAHCNVRCISCPAGRQESQPDGGAIGGLMTPEFLDAAMQRIEDQNCKIISATFHFYNEPSLHPRMAELIEVAHKHKVNGLISSNLTSKNSKLWPNTERIVRTGIKNIIVSVSGWTQEIYERSHKNGDVEEVKKNMEQLARIRTRKQFVRVSWHRYHYNKEEEPLMKEFAESLGFQFTPYETGLLPLEEPLKKFKMLQYGFPHVQHTGERDIATKLDEAYKLCIERKHRRCINQGRMITLLPDGTIQPCCVKNHDEGRHANIFEVDLEQFNNDRLFDPACISCQSLGGHIYAMQQYRRPLGKKVEFQIWLENLWRDSNLGGLLPNLSALYSQKGYVRPKRKTK